MEEYIAKCNQCGHVMTLEKVIKNGAVVLTALYKCPNCGKKCIAEFDKFYDIDKPDLYDLDANGYDTDGYDADGYDRDGYDSGGFDRMHIHRETSTPFNPSGYDWEDYDADGLDERGFDREGFYKKTGERYNEAGFDWHGFDKDGYDKYGIDRYGNHRPGNKKSISKENKKMLIYSFLWILVLLGIYLLLKFS